MRILFLLSLLLSACSYSENGGESWNRVQFIPTGSASIETHSSL